MMLVERWDPEKHLDILTGWLRAREEAEDAGPPGLYPPTGFVVDNCAAGFLFVTNAPLIGYIDGIATDPHVTSRRRYHAIEALLAVLLNESRHHGIRLLCAATAVVGLSGMGQQFGFKVLGHGYQYLGRKE
jgi:hypothetical protein